MTIAEMTHPPRLQASDLLPMTPAHLEGAVALSRAAGWPHRAEDWALTLAYSEGVVALEAGRVVATGMVTRFGDVATLNMIIVDASLRGRGMGRALMTRLMQMAAGCELRLVATSDGLPLYEKLGFRATGDIAQHQGPAIAAEPCQPVETGGPADLDRIAAADLAASGMDRRALLAELTRHGEVLLTRDGVALIRRFGRGHVLGPIIAETPGAAQALMSAAAGRSEGRFLRVDLVAGQGLEAHAASLGLAPVGGGTAMVLSPRGRDAAAAKTYGLISQALG